jgi:uncharacterized membrane protein
MSDRSLRLVLAAGAFAGLGIAAYLTAVHLRGGAPICFTSGCESVQRSAYAELFGLPVASLGVGVYALLLASAATRARTAAAGAAAVALAAVVFSSYLLFVQAETIHALCSWCLASDALTDLVAATAVVRLRRLLA